MFWVEPLADHRRLAHRIADEVVYQFTGERGVAETKIARLPAGHEQELVMIDYDGFNQAPITNLHSTSLSPAWSPVDSSVAFTSFFKGTPTSSASTPSTRADGARSRAHVGLAGAQHGSRLERRTGG